MVTIAQPGLAERLRAGQRQDERGNLFDADCPTRLILDRIGDKWTVLLVILLSESPMRFTELRTHLGRVAPKVLTQSLRRMERDIAGARESFSGIYGRQPNENELAAAVSLTLTELRERRHEIASSEVTSLNSMVLTTEAAIERIDTLASTNRESDPEFAGAMSEAKAKFRRAFAALSEREREIAVLMYVKNMTLREIGQILGVSESRVCQIHGQLKHRLREALRRDADLFQEVA